VKTQHINRHQRKLNQFQHKDQSFWSWSRQQTIYDDDRKFSKTDGEHNQKTDHQAEHRVFSRTASTKAVATPGSSPSAANCSLASFAYSPFIRISSACVPDSTILPSVRT